MSRKKKSLFGIRVTSVISLLTTALLCGCTAPENKQEIVPEDLIISEALVDDNMADSSVGDLLPSTYSESDFDTSDSIIFKTEHPVISKEMEEISYTIENFTDEELEYGEEYVLEIKSGEQWYQVPFPENYGFNAIAYILPGKAINGGILNLSWMDFEYVDGEYRIIKKIGECLVKAEFSMGDSPITPQTPFGYGKLEDLPLEYGFDEAIEDGVVVLGYEETYNAGRLKDFAVNSKLGIPSMVRIGFSTIEGDAIFYDCILNVTSDGREWYTLYHDSRRDEFAAEENCIITKANYSYIVTDGENIYFSDCAEYSDSEIINEASRIIYVPDKYRETEEYAQIITIIEDITTSRLAGNWNRYKSFSPEGTYYVSLNEEQIKSADLTFGFGAKGYGISDLGFAVLPDGNVSLTGFYKVQWLDDETAQFIYKTDTEDLFCFVEFYPKEALEKNDSDAIGQIRYGVLDAELMICR